MATATLQPVAHFAELATDKRAEKSLEAAGTKARILDAAEELFMEHGFEATSLRLITTAAGRESGCGELPFRLERRAISSRAHA